MPDFLDIFRQRMRRPPYQTPGFAGGYLLDDGGQDDAGLVMPKRTSTGRMEERVIEPTTGAILGVGDDRDYAPLARPEPTPIASSFKGRFSQTRPRIADRVTFGTEKLRDFEDEPMGWRDKLGLVSQSISQNLGYKPLPTRRQMRLGRVEQQLERDAAAQENDFKRRLMQQKLKPEPTKFEQRSVTEGEYGLPEGTIINRVWDGEKWVDELQDGKPIIAKPSRPQAAESKYFERPEGVFTIEGGRGKQIPGIPGKAPSDAQAAQAAEGEAIAASTSQAADEIRKEADDFRARLTANEGAIKRKEATWRTEANRRFKERMASYDPLIDSKDAKPNLKDILEEVKAEDSDYQNGTWDELISNTEGLRTGIKDNDKRLKDMQEEIRRGQAKGARSRTTSKSGRTIEGAINAFRTTYKREPTADEIARMEAALKQ